MRMSFHRIAYEALEVCNALEMATVDDAVARAGLPAGARALDIGCGNASVSIRLADKFGLAVTAVELDPAMADLAEARIAASGAASRVTLERRSSGAVLAGADAFDLIVAIGTTQPAGGGLLEPADIFPRLAAHLTPGGWLLWGDLTWRDAPPEPLRRLVEAGNRYLDDAGWRATAARSGLETVQAEISADATWDRYVEGMDGAARAWLAANPKSPEAAAVTAAADRVKAMFDFGRPWLDFGLYLFRKAA